MKNLFCIVIALSLFIISCSKENVETTKSGEKNTLQKEALVANENILAKTLLYTEWSTVPTIMSLSYNYLRNTIVSNLDNKCNDLLTTLSGMNDSDLAWGSLMYKFLLDAGTKTAPELLSMSLDDFRNTIISLNASNTAYTVGQLQGFANNKNLNIAYGWWFYQNSSTKSKIDKINNIAGSGPSFDKKDSRSVGMDVLRVVKADEVYTYLGVYHNQVNANHFKLNLAGSNDLISWTFITEIGDRAHQGDIEKWGTGYLVANEQDPIEGSNNVQIRYYSSYANLIVNNPSNNKSISRTFSSLAEGTPDIRKVEGSGPASSHIEIGYHYYDNGVRDQQAIGILYNFSTWRTWKDEISNYNIQQMGYNGNIGGRSGFTHSGNYVLQEAQITSGDWSSWRFLFGDGAFYYTLHPTTPLGSTSFANPGIALVSGTNTFAVTSFMPTEGNKSGEIGDLLYTVQF